jgi:hypothetical protein
MKRSLLSTLFVAAIMSSPLALAQEVRPAPAAPGQMQPGDMGMMDEKQMAQMQESLKQMHAQMERMRETTDPEERRRLMQEHMQSMREHGHMMHGMGGGMMMQSAPAK